MCRVVVTERTNTSSVMAVVLVWGKSSSTPSRERKNLTRAERERFRRTENTRTNTAAVTSRSEQSRDKKKKKKERLFERFESFEFFERFSTAGRSRFPPQNRGVGQKREIDRSKKRRAQKKAKSVSILVRI